MNIISPFCWSCCCLFVCFQCIKENESEDEQNYKETFLFVCFKEMYPSERRNSTFVPPNGADTASGTWLLNNNNTVIMYLTITIKLTMSTFCTNLLHTLRNTKSYDLQLFITNKWLCYLRFVYAQLFFVRLN